MTSHDERGKTELRPDQRRLVKSSKQPINLSFSKECISFFCQIGEVSLTDNESGEMIAANDVNKDGKMDFFEFKRMMTSNKQQNESTNYNQEWNHRNTYHSRPYL